MSHTPGQWYQGTDPRRIESDAGTIVANVSGALSNDAVIADARLIAAAPDLLLAAVRAASDMSWAEESAGANFQSSLILLRAAIAKAYGDEQ
jgi:hypothetical protein